MQLYDVFNGDADGLCSLHQFRLAEPAESRLITGVKRDIRLLSRIESGKESLITVFDISFDKNRGDTVRLLTEGARILYFDHHHAGEIPVHPCLCTHINPAPDRGTSFMVDRYIRGKFRAWAVAGSFGDNFDETARRLAESLNMSTRTVEELRQLGILLNYNGYGASVKDLFFPPADLYLSMKEYTDPVEFMHSSPVFEKLREGYTSDMNLASGIKPVFSQNGSRIFILPDMPWARRVSGVFANMLAGENPEGAHAVLTALPGGGYVVSVRAPLADRRDAHTLCMKFPTGGGRAAAAGINLLPEGGVEKFIEEFQKIYTNR